MSKRKYYEGTVVTATELKQNLGKYLDSVCDDQSDVVITKNGNKIARLTPYITDIEQYFLVKENSLDYQYGGKKVSYEEFELIHEKSTLRMEYINGEIVLMTSPNLWHQEILGLLYMLFKNYFSGKQCRVVLAPFDTKFYKPEIKDPDVMQPDLSVICDIKGNVNAKGRYLGIPALVLEILSSSTRSKDLVDKLNTFMLSGVKEYWVVDPKQRQVLVYEFAERSIENFMTYKKGEKIQSRQFEGLAVEVDRIFEDLPASDFVNEY